MDWLIGLVAMAVSLGATAAASEKWHWPYQLRSAQTVQRRWGRIAARLYFLLVAMLMGGAAFAILVGVRPRYASVRVVPAKLEAAR